MSGLTGTLDQLARMPVVAILRGVTPDEVVDVAAGIHAAGIGIIEVPLNSPDALRSIEHLADRFGEACVIGAGTVLAAAEADAVAEAGGRICVSPDTCEAVIHRALARGLLPVPGWSTPSEALAAIRAGALLLKLFPAGSVGLEHLRAVRAVLPNDAAVLAVGGVGAHNAGQWLDAGAAGLGIGSEIYRAGADAGDVAERARRVVQAVREARGE